MGIQRIFDETAVALMPAVPTLTGVQGFFTNGVPGSVPSTVVPDWWLNMNQEAWISLMLAARLPIDGTATAKQALDILYGVTFTHASTNNNVIHYPGGLIVQTSTAAVPAGDGLLSTTLTLPFTFPTNIIEAQVCFLGNTPPGSASPGSISVQPTSPSQVTVTTNYDSVASGVLGVVISTKGY